MDTGKAIGLSSFTMPHRKELNLSRMYMRGFWFLQEKKIRWDFAGDLFAHTNRLLYFNLTR